MKTKLYIFLTCGILVLLIVAGLLTRTLFQLSVPEVSKPKPAQQPPKQVVPISETYIEVGPVTKAPVKIVGAPKPATPSVQAPIEAQKQTSAVPAVVIGVVVEVRGTAFSTGAGGKMRSLTKDSRIYLDERVETSSTSSIKIKFEDGTVLSEGEKSSIVIDKYVCNPGDKAKTGFGMYLIKGACHMVTGSITEINPDKFKVRTRLATVGIRGCELAFRSKPEQDDIYVLGLDGRDKIIVDTTTDGSQMVNVFTKEDLPVELAKRKTIDVSESGIVVSIVSGKGPEEHAIGLKEADGIMTETSSLAPAQHNMNITQDGAVFTIQPQTRAAGKENGAK
jgi:hypothetical protein